MFPSRRMQCLVAVPAQIFVNVFMQLVIFLYLLDSGPPSLPSLSTCPTRETERRKAWASYSQSQQQA